MALLSDAGAKVCAVVPFNSRDVEWHSRDVD
jgi:hypothetical protein